VAGIALAVVVSGLILTGRGMPSLGAPRTLVGVFGDVRGLRPDAPVRLAGVPVGRVREVALGDDGLARVTMELDDDAPGLRRGTRLRLHPRVFLEGGYAVQVEPGPPGGPVLRSGATVPASRTSASVPLPAVTGALDAATREGLRTTVAQTGRALARAGSARTLARDLSPALRDATRIASAARGERPGELRTLLRDAAAVTGALGADRARLAGTIVGLRRTAGATGAEEAALRGTLRELPRISARVPAALRAIRAARPVIDEMLDDAGPALRAAPSALSAADGTLGQARRLASDAELPALLTQARPLLDALGPLMEDGSATLEQATPLLRCLRDRLVPAFGMRVEDGRHTTGQTVLQELLTLSVGLASSGGGFDANGWMVRLGATVGPRILTAGSAAGVGPFAASTAGVTGARPVWYGSRGLPPFRPDAACADQPLPDLRAASRPVATSPAPSLSLASEATAAPPSTPADVAALRTRLKQWLGAPGDADPQEDR
jgi:phospholipid/cholesterol/gamma-HCH transport system substrate-binding protein